MSSANQKLRDLVPRREDLLLKIQQANQYVGLVILFHVVTIGALAFFIDWIQVINRPLLYIIASGVVVGPFALQILQRLAQKRKEIGDLKESTRFGQFDKHRLRVLFNETLQKLGLPQVHLPVYVTADRTMNAYSSHLGYGLAVLFPQLNGIYLNRQLLRKFEPAEVQDTMGHELGHYYAHYLKSTRYYLLSCLVGIVLAIGITQWVGLDSIVGYLSLAICASAAFFFTSRRSVAQIHAIEYLCDDFGAHVNGIEAGINGLMKLGAAAEVETTIFFESLLSHKFAKLSAPEILETLQQAIPYGHVSQTELEQAVQTQLVKQTQKGPSLSGFFKYAWQGDAEAEMGDELKEYAKTYQRLRAMPRLDWESLLVDPTRVKFYGETLSQLIEMIEDHPGIPLFHELPADTANDTHPPTFMRVLYLWYNREGIASSSALPRSV